MIFIHLQEILKHVSKEELDGCWRTSDSSTRAQNGSSSLGSMKPEDTLVASTVQSLGPLRDEVLEEEEVEMVAMEKIADSSVDTVEEI